MKSFMCGAALAVLAMGLGATATQAQTYDRLVVFGDSLSDNGNLFMATAPNSTPPAPYWQGRFADGPVFTERLGFNAVNFMGPVNGSINMAFGGARTDTEAAPLGMLSQLGLYRTRGGTFGKGDLVTVLGGANNLFQGLPAAAVSPNPTATFAATAKAAAVDVNTLVGQVASLGAGTVLVINLPQLSVTPQFAGTAGAALGDYGATTYNTELANLTRATAAANAGTNIIQMNIYAAGATVAADPAAFGIRNVTAPCLSATGLCSNPAEYFYFDGVHPTAAGHAILARLTNDYLYYGKAGAQAAILGETAWRHREDEMADATSSLSVRQGWDEGTRLNVTALADTYDVDARGNLGKTTSEGYGVRIGLESASPQWRFGLAGSYRMSEVEGGAMKADVDSYSLDVYTGWRSNNVFINAAMGGAVDNYRDINRLTALAPVVHASSTTGTSIGARVQGGLWMGQGPWHLSPRGAVSWTATDVDGFKEQGVAANYEYHDRRVEAFNAELSLRAEYDAARLRFYAEGGWREALSENSDDMRIGLSGNTAKVLSESVDLPFDSHALVNVGVESQIGEHVKVHLGYRGRFGDGFDSHLGALRFSIPL